MLSRFFTRQEQLVMIFLGCSIIIGSAVIYWAYASEPEVVPGVEIEPSEIHEDFQVQENESVKPKIEPLKIVVSVQGAVQYPEVYRFVEEARVNDALELAGGVEPLADTTSINLAAPLVDGSTIYIPLRKKGDDGKRLLKNHASYLLEGNPRPLSENNGVPARSRVNINTATQSELESLPGVGPSYARAIIEYRKQRPFNKVDDIMSIRGIGGKRYEEIRELISVR